VLVGSSSSEHGFESVLDRLAMTAQGDGKHVIAAVATRLDHESNAAGEFDQIGGVSS